MSSFFWKNPSTDSYELTHAGDELINGNQPLHVLRCQLLRMQYPSVYGLSNNVKMDPSLKIQPFCFLVKLLQDERLDFKLTNQDMVIPVVYAHLWKNYESCVQKILDLRAANEDLTKIIKDPQDLIISSTLSRFFKQ